MEGMFLFDALSYLSTINMFGIDCDYNELYDKEGKANYDAIVEKLKTIQLPDSEEFSYTSLMYKEMMELLEELLVKILGDDFLYEIKKIGKKVSAKGNRHINGCKALIKNTFTGAKLGKIIISKDFVTLQVANLAHEYMHAILAKYIKRYDEVLGNIHYDELICILIEYIMCYELDKIYNNDKLLDKNNIIRLESLKNGALDLEASQQLYYEISSFIRHSVYGFIVSDIYAGRLFDLYKDDKSIMNRLVKVLKGEEELESLLEYYNISLKNGEAVDTFVKKIDRYNGIKMQKYNNVSQISIK